MERGVGTFTIHEAKTQLSKLIALAEAGEEVVIARGNDAVVRLEPISSKAEHRGFGAMKGIWPDLPDAFWFDSLPEDELRLWEGRDEDPVG